MSDLAERLRGVSTRRDMFQDPDTLCSRALLAEAADEIERLRAATLNAINQLNRMAADSGSATRMAFREAAEKIAGDLNAAYQQNVETAK